MLTWLHRNLTDGTWTIRHGSGGRAHRRDAVADERGRLWIFGPTYSPEPAR